MEVIIKPSSKKDKKYDAVIDGKKTVSFGAAGASDFTQHKKMKLGNRGTLIDIRTGRIGPKVALRPLVSMLKMSCGTNHL